MAFLTPEQRKDLREQLEDLLKLHEIPMIAEAAGLKASRLTLTGPLEAQIESLLDALECSDAATWQKALDFVAERYPTLRRPSLAGSTSYPIAGTASPVLAPPPEPNPVFVGRAPEMAELERWLLSPSGEAAHVAICALQGMPGIGKTCLAEEFCARHAGAFPGGVIRLSLDPDKVESADALLARVADAAEVRAPARVLAAQLNERLPAVGALLHIDNVDSDALVTTVAGLAKLLPKVKMIVTGRHQGLGKAGGGRWHRVELQTLSLAHGVELLSRELLSRELGERGVSATTRRELERLVEELGHLPLAIHLAAGYLGDGHTVESFLEALRRARLALGPASPDDPTLADPRRATLHATFALSWELLCRSPGGERASSTLAALAQLPATPFGLPLAGAAAALDEVDVREDLRRLINLSVLTSSDPTPQRPRCRLHPLLRSWIRDHKPAAEATERVDRWILAQLPEGEDQAQRWSLLDQEHEALGGWLGAVGGETCVQVVIQGYDYADSHGPFAAWVEAARRGMGRTEDPQKILLLAWRLGNLARKLGDGDLALATMERHQALARAQGMDREVALAASLRADILHGRGELDRALSTLRGDVLPTFERLSAVQERAVALGKIADILQARGELDEALRIRREEQLPVFERLGDVRNRAITLGKVANIIHALGESAEALRIYREGVLPVYERVGDLRECAVALGRVADILHDRGELDEALRIHWEEELPVYERLGDVRSSAVTRGKVADILQARGELDEALRLRREEVLPVYERLGDVHSLVRGRTNLAILLMEKSSDLYRAEAARLLALALADAERLRIPEAGQIRKHQRRFGFA